MWHMLQCHRGSDCRAGAPKGVLPPADLVSHQMPQDRVLIEKVVAPTKSVGGVLLPDSAVSKVRAWLGGVQRCGGSLVAALPCCVSGNIVEALLRHWA